jgi:hypothetical protein
MARKDNDPCRDNAAADEPIFTLRAHDELAPDTVRFWAERAISEGVPPKKIDEAIQLAQEMESWQKENGSKVPD